jgi:hypothetical protein
MATSTIPAAIDHLVTAVRALPAFAAPVVVCDGWPDQRGNTGIVIGVTPDDDTTDDLNMHAELGAQAQWEEYDIPCLVWSYVGGGQESMKTARDAAFALYDALDTYLRAHRSLDDVLRSGTAYISRVAVQQTGNAPEAGEGRSCVLAFTIRCKSRSAA